MYEKTIGSRQVFAGRLLKLDVLDIEMENGVRSIREVVRHPGASAVLARQVDGRFVFVRQFRKALERDVLEIIAGLPEPGETPEACARREVREETGYGVRVIQHLGSCLPSVGYLDEKIEIFFAELSDERESPCLDDDEHVENVYLSAAEIDAMIQHNEIQDAKTLVAWLLYEKMHIRIQNQS